MVISVAKHEILKPPLCPPKKIPGKNILKKIIYIPRTKRMVILRGNQKNLKPPTQTL